MMKISLISALLCAIIGYSHAFLASTSNNNARVQSSLHMTVLTANGKKIDIREGTPLKAACAKLGVKPKYSCKK